MGVTTSFARFSVDSTMKKKRIITLHVSGGLGNQMFQYAAARSAALRCDADLVLDLSFYHRGRHRNFELNHFNIAAVSSPLPRGKVAALMAGLISTLRARSVYRENSFHYNPKFEHVNAPALLQGYFQSYKYFQLHENQIRHELRPPDVYGAYNQSLANRIASNRSAIVHLRRGDYISNPKAQKTFAECKIDYYKRALALIPTNSPIFVFSDDIDWAKNNLKISEGATYVGDGTPRTSIEDLKLMSLGYHHIIANSTFSWWGAWLAGSEKGITVAPSRWFVDESIQDSDLFPPGWIRC